MTDDVWRDGWAAAALGKLLSTNPLPVSSSFHSLWSDGWRVGARNTEQ